MAIKEFSEWFSFLFSQCFLKEKANISSFFLSSFSNKKAVPDQFVFPPSSKLPFGVL